MTDVVIDATGGDDGAGAMTPQAAGAGDDGQLLARSESEQELLSRYREVLLASDTGIDPSLVKGETLAEIDASFVAARDVADRARGSMGPGITRVSPGSPGRRSIGPSTPFEKIRDGLARRAG
jgi:hypothetical protein